MKAKSLIIWSLLLNVFDCSICLTTVWLRNLLLDPDTPLSCSPHTLWKFRLRFRQHHNSGSYRDIWRKAEVKLCSGQTVMFDILLTTKSCPLPSSSPMTLSLYLLERQSVGLDLKKRFIFHLPGCISLNTTSTIDQMIESNGTRVLVGYENGSRKLRQTDSSYLNKTTSQTGSNDAILPSRSGLFRNVVWRSRRHTDDLFKEEDDLRRQTVLKRDNKLPLEYFTGSKSESDMTQFRLLQETTKLGRKFLQAAFSNDVKKTNSTIDKTVTAASRDSLNNSNPDDIRLRTQLLGKTFEDRGENKSGNLKSAENTSRRKIDPYSTLLSHQPLVNTEYVSSASSLSFRPTSTDNRIHLISSSIPATPNSNWNTATELPVVESSTRIELTSKQRKVISLFNTKTFAPSDQTVSLTMKPFRTSTTIGPLVRTSGQPELSSSTHIITTTGLMPKVSHNSITSHKTTKSKDITSTLRTSAADTSIITTMSTGVESTASPSSLRGSTPQTKKTSSTEQPTSPETTPTSKQKSTDYHRSTIITSPSQTPTTTTTTKAITTTRPLSSTTSKAPTMTSRIATATSESSTRSSRLSTSVTTYAVTVLGENVTIANSSAPTNTSTNSTLENETTTFLSHHTDKNAVQEDDTYFWPVVLSLVIGIPAIIVFSIAMVVIMRKRNIDSSTFFMGPPIGDEEV